MVQKKLLKYFFKISLNQKIINCLMVDGEKHLSEKIFFTILKLLQQTSLKSIQHILKFSLLKISPTIVIYQNKRKKRIINEIPFLLKRSLRIVKAIKNIIKISRVQSNIFFSEYFKNEIINILKKNSYILNKKEELQNYALNKKAFSHYRWF